MIVIDASVYLAALFEDERHEAAINIQLAIRSRQEAAYAPPIFFYEIYNAIMMGLRRNRYDWNIARQHISHAESFPVQTDLRQPMQHVAELSHKHQLTIYDASYLELAARKQAPLATFDKALANAAKAEGILCLFS